ncbi:MAG: hypothetical protein VX460_12940, partial [Planctomycetota bacterium]|nr:hypothetical protein [Planctomycetota bacterium]
PRAIHAEHLDALKALMSRGAGRITRHELDEQGRGSLPGAAASLRGKALRYEGDRDSIGYWRHEGDYAEWELKIPAGRTLELCLELSCAPAAAGGTARVEVDGIPPHEVEVTSTGGWDDFEVRPALVFEVATSGVRRVRVINAKMEGPLMKLRSVEVRPVVR